MNIVFTKDTNRIPQNRIVHIIEHEGYGTLHQLIEPLVFADSRHSVICSNCLSSMFFEKNVNYIIHCTGHMYPLVSSLDRILNEHIKISLFLHVAPKYLILKNKDCFIDYLRMLQKQYGLKLFCPSEKLSEEYGYYALTVKFVQMGINSIDLNESNLDMLKIKPYCNKYITTCTSSDPRYIDLKGVNEFVSVMEMMNKTDDALICGFNGMYRNVRCVLLDPVSFLTILKNATCYMQFSKTEAYNITAVQAKRLKVPVIVSDIEGHIDCMKNKLNRVNILQLHTQNDIENIITQVSDFEVIELNYKDSIQRENLNAFSKNIIDNILQEE